MDTSSELLERISKLEECILFIKKISEEQKDQQKEILEKIEKLNIHVNEEVKNILLLISKQQEELISFRITQKILIFLAGISVTGVVSLVLDLVRRSLMP
jgi:hypothetical protein